MSLMVWFRKHKNKIMAIVVVGLMIVFTIDPLMNYLSSRRTGGRNVIATYSRGEKITTTDLAWAQKQLDILGILGVRSFLQPQDPQMYPSQDLRMTFLGELLFTERGTSGQSINYLKQIVRMGNYPVSEAQINAIYLKDYPADMYWLMLVKEAQAAGVRMPAEAARKQLETLIPRIHQNVTYAQFVSAVVGRQQVSEEQFVETFADLMSVIEYGRMITSLQDVTSQQVLYEMDMSRQTLDVNYVQLFAKTFVDESKQPAKEQIDSQFDKYKDFFAGQISDTNPYGFGYKLPDRVQLEYIAVRLDDVAATVAPIKQEEAEDYYQQHLQSPFFYRRVPSDPNDPNSPLEYVLRSYAEVAPALIRQLYQDKVDSKAEQIMQEAKSITEANMMGIEDEQNKLTDEQIRQSAVDYEKIAEQLGEKYKIKVYSGKTGLLSAVDIQSDKELGLLYLENRGISAVGLLRLVFAVEPLKSSILGPFDPKPPRLYQNIGPLRDVRQSSQGYADKNMMLVRVIRAEKSSVPVSLDQKLDKRTVQFNQNTPAADANSIKELVINDLRLLAAMDVTKNKADEFIKLAVKESWKAAIDKFNELYAPGAKGDANEAVVFKMQSPKNRQRIPETAIKQLEILHQGDPLGSTILDRAKMEKILLDKFYALAAADVNTPEVLNSILEFKPALSYYCIENLVVHPLYRESFEISKAMEIARDDYDNSQALAAVLYNPEDIMKRMSFKLTRDSARPAQAGEANDVNEATSPR
jgi:hypothetical protein